MTSSSSDTKGQLTRLFFLVFCVAHNPTARVSTRQRGRAAEARNSAQRKVFGRADHSDKGTAHVASSGF
jgi:hypothetical protein